MLRLGLLKYVSIYIILYRTNRVERKRLENQDNKSMHTAVFHLGTKNSNISPRHDEGPTKVILHALRAEGKSHKKSSVVLVFETMYLHVPVRVYIMRVYTKYMFFDKNLDLTVFVSSAMLALTMYDTHLSCEVIFM